jgi:hypothetical protein
MKLELGEVRPGPGRAIDPRSYHEAADPKRPPVAERPPVCLYLEVTNRCNLLCTTCPRTYEELEAPAEASTKRSSSMEDRVTARSKGRRRPGPKSSSNRAAATAAPARPASPPPAPTPRSSPSWTATAPTTPISPPT